MSVNFKPAGDLLLVEPLLAESKTASGIIIPEAAKEKPAEAIVIAIGPGKNDQPIKFEVGDKVVYGKYSGTEMILNKKKYLVIRESDIFGTLYEFPSDDEIKSKN